MSAPHFGTLLFLTVALVVYGSTYPWDFAGVGPIGENPLWLLLHTWPVDANRFMFRDLFLNLLLYVPVGVFAYLKLAAFFSPLISAALAIGAGAVLSASMEIAQQFEITRASSAVDLVSNIAGTAVGVALGRAYRSTLARWSSLPVAVGGGEARGALLLLAPWVAFQLVPLFPALSTYRLAEEIRNMFQPGSFVLSDFFTVAGEWMAVARLVEVLSDSSAMLPVLMLMVPARLFIAGRTASLSELMGVMAAWLLWTLWLAKHPRRTGWTAGFALGAIVIRGLAPFKFSSSAQRFSWIPLAGSLSYEYSAAIIPLLRKLFIYGAALWLLHKSGVRRLIAALVVAAMLGAIDAVQVYLPAQSPEITDPLLALLVAGALRLLDPRPIPLPHPR